MNHKALALESARLAIYFTRETFSDLAAYKVVDETFRNQSAVWLPATLALRERAERAAHYAEESQRRFERAFDRMVGL